MKLENQLLTLTILFHNVIQKEVALFSLNNITTQLLNKSYCKSWSTRQLLVTYLGKRYSV